MKYKIGLIGKNISYSKSPEIHSFLAQNTNIDLSYELLDIDENEVSLKIEQLRQGAYHGFNVTTPYKQSILRHIDELTKIAEITQSVNTVYMEEKKVIGDNTDYIGFLELLKRNKIIVDKKMIYLLGTGGVAKTIYTALNDLGALVTVVTRDPQQKKPFFSKIISYDEIETSKCDFFIQATPIGTFPDIKQSVLSKKKVKKKMIIDLVYNPSVTQIMKDSKKGINGETMLMVQAIKSFEVWTRTNINDRDELMNKLKKVIFKWTVMGRYSK